MVATCADCGMLRWGVMVHDDLFDDRARCSLCAVLKRQDLARWRLAFRKQLDNQRERYLAGIYADDDPYLQPPPKSYQGYGDDAVA